jgi:hypothetical protein
MEKRFVNYLIFKAHINMFKGDDAPKGVHPEFVRKANTSKGNHSQRYPYVSKEVEENPEEAELLTEMIHLITIIVEYHVSTIFLSRLTGLITLSAQKIFARRI